MDTLNHEFMYLARKVEIGKQTFDAFTVYRVERAEDGMITGLNRGGVKGGRLSVIDRGKVFPAVVASLVPISHLEPEHPAYATVQRQVLSSRLEFVGLGRECAAILLAFEDAGHIDTFTIDRLIEAVWEMPDDGVNNDKLRACIARVLKG